MSVAAVSRANLLKTRLERFVATLKGVEKRDVKSVHRARVASRRLRELVPVLQLDQDGTRKLSRRLRKVTKRLGAVRELDVLLLLIDELHVSRPIHQAALRRVGAAAAKACNEARRRLLSHLPSEDLWRIARKLDRVREALTASEGSGVSRPDPSQTKAVGWAIDARVANRATRVAAATRSAGAVYLPERLHEVRINVKKLRYALELAAEARGEKNTPALRTLKRVQALLGRMHDLQVLIERVREVQASLTPPNLAVWRELDALVVALDEMCRRLHARYVGERDGIEHLAAKLTASSSAAPSPAGVGARAAQRAG